MKKVSSAVLGERPGNTLLWLSCSRQGLSQQRLENEHYIQSGRSRLQECPST